MFPAPALNAAWLLETLLDTIYPETCALCGKQPHQVRWCERGPVVPGLNRWDHPHLCLQCQAQLSAPQPVIQDRELPDGSLLGYLGAGRTTGDLTRVVGVWKYQGVRGLSWPLAEMLARALSGRPGISGSLLPVPLHRRRRRERGFNQAALLAHLLAPRLGLPVVEHMARRIRHTGQQARLKTSSDRQRNLAGSFAVKPPPKGGDRRLIMVDDLVTSGATTAELALSLERAGWTVVMVLAVGLGRHPATG